MLRELGGEKKGGNLESVGLTLKWCLLYRKCWEVGLGKKDQEKGGLVGLGKKELGGLGIVGRVKRG